MALNEYRGGLPKSHVDALYGACAVLIDHFMDDVSDLLAEKSAFEDTFMADFLPTQYRFHYNTLFAKKFLICVIAVASKLAAPTRTDLACVAEELALYAIVQMAETLLKMDGVKADFSTFEDLAFKDMDFLFFLGGEMDGFEDTPSGKELGIVNLHFNQWFTPFYGAQCPVNPYVSEKRNVSGRPRPPRIRRWRRSGGEAG